MSQIASINSNQSVFATKSLTNLEQGQDLPKWLLEFDSFGREDKAEGKQTRPLTESHLRNRPKWFEDLKGQRRRLSEFVTMEATESSVILPKARLESQSKTEHLPSPILETVEQENEPKKMTTTKKPTFQGPVTRRII